jgi:N-acetylneuraminic acid mutarotase
VVGDEIWFPSPWTEGGGNPKETLVASIYIYNIVTDTWRTKPGLAVARRRASTTAQYYNGFIYISHGNRGNRFNSTAVNWFDRYNITNGQWTALPNAQFARDHAGAGIVNGSWFCVAGGRDGGLPNPAFFNATILQTECYDLLAGVNGVWTTKANITQGRAGAAFGMSCDGKLMVAGGEGFGKAWKNVDMFDGQTWTSLPDLKEARHGTGLAVSCNCGGQQQVHITVGRPCQGGGNQCTINLNTTETLFSNGVNVPCTTPQNRKLVMDPPSTSLRGGK